MLLSPLPDRVSGKAGVLGGFIALNLLPFKGNLTHAEAAHTDMLNRQYNTFFF
jgi:hypothetical protein